MTDQAWLTLQLLCTLTMVGVIWFVQVVHYPLLQRVGDEQFVQYEREHVRRTGWIVGPLMVAELVGAVLLWTTAVGRTPLATWALVLLAAIWISTFAIQSPLHSRLCQSFDLGKVRLLVATNWFRTAAWSARGILLCLLLGKA